MAKIGFDHRAFLSFIVFVGVIGMVASGVVAVMKFPQFQSKASLTTKPSLVHIVNITDESITLFWQTELKTRGFISYGTSPDLGRTRLDNRDVASGQEQQYQNHVVTLNNLSPKTKYYYTIGANSDVYDRDGFPYTFFTGSKLSGKEQQGSLKGRILTNDRLPATGYFITLTFESQRTNTISNVIGSITESGGIYTIPLAYLRTNDGLESFPLVASENYTVEATLYSTEGTTDTQSFIYSPENTFPTLLFKRPLADQTETTFPVVDTPLASIPAQPTPQSSLLEPQPTSSFSAIPTNVNTVPASTSAPTTPTPRPTIRPSLRLLL